MAPQRSAKMWQHANTTALGQGPSEITCVQLAPCAHCPLTTGVPCPYSKKEGGSPVARTTADLYKLVRVGGTVLCRECSCLGFRSHPFSAARPTHYSADKMPSQLKQNKPSDLSESSLCMKSYIKMTLILII